MPYGGLIAGYLMQQGIIAKGTPEARQGLAQGMVVDGIVWSILGVSKTKGPSAPAPAAAGGGPAPPVVVAPSGEGTLVGAGVLVNVAAGAGELTTVLSTGGGSGSGDHPRDVESRPLTADDLGAEGKIEELTGTFSVKDGVARVRVDMIRGKIQNPLQIMRNLIGLARQNGATTLKVEGTLANPRLLDVLSKRYGIATDGATDTITIPLEGGEL